MTVESFADPVTYAYTGPGDFTFSFRVFGGGDLTVTHTDTVGVITVLVKDTNYTVTALDESPYGGTVHCTYSAVTGYLEIRRELDFTQETDWVNNDDLDAEVLERSFDRLIMLLQQVKTDVDQGNATTSWRGEWAALTDYEVFDVTAASTGLYLCIKEHTSGSSLASGVGAGYWHLIFDPSVLIGLELPEISPGDALKFLQVKSDESGCQYKSVPDSEPPLGNPSISGQFLASTTGGTRSWASVPRAEVVRGIGMEGTGWGMDYENSSTTDLKVYKGSRLAMDGATTLTLSSDTTIAGSTALGSSLSANTLYHLYVVKLAADSSIVVRLSATEYAPGDTLPVAWTAAVWVGIMRTNASSQFSSQVFRNGCLAFFKGSECVIASTLSTSYTTFSLTGWYPTKRSAKIHYGSRAAGGIGSLSYDGTNEAVTLYSNSTYADAGPWSFGDRGNAHALPVKSSTMYAKTSSDTLSVLAVAVFFAR